MKVFDAIAERRGWTYSQIADLTIDQFLYVATEGRSLANQEAAVSPEELEELFRQAEKNMRNMPCQSTR